MIDLKIGLKKIIKYQNNLNLKIMRYIIIPLFTVLYLYLSYGAIKSWTGKFKSVKTYNKYINQECLWYVLTFVLFAVLSILYW